MVEYKTLVLRGDMETAAEVLETIPKVWRKGWGDSCSAGWGASAQCRWFRVRPPCPCGSACVRLLHRSLRPQPPSAACLFTTQQDQHNSIAKFLEAKGMPEQALEVATDAGRQEAGAWAAAAPVPDVVLAAQLCGSAAPPRLPSIPAAPQLA